VANEVGSPTVRRRELGTLLRALRTEAGLTVEQVAEALLVSASKVSRLETGQRGASQRDIRDLCNLYGLEDPGRREHLAMLAREGKQQAWWQAAEWPKEISTFVGLEVAASSIREFESDVVPGLLQTEAYARALARTAVPAMEAEKVERYVRARVARQEILARAEPPTFHAVIDEAVLHRQVGAGGVMRDQLDQIVHMAGMPSATVQVLPFAAGMHPATESTFIILEYSPQVISSVVYIETLTGNLYLEREADLSAYSLVFDRLCDMALAPDQTLALLKHLRDTRWVVDR
jgi:transcriptional regulator with XRE-family HTH domain